MSNTFDIIAIGDTLTDAFIKLKHADILDSIDHTAKELCMTFGDKIPYEFVKVVKGVGNSANVAAGTARLGLKTALASDVGDDQNGKECIGALADKGVSVDYVRMHKGFESNYHYVLWYNSERTILVKHQEYPYALPKLEDAPKWIYLSSLGENSLDFHKEISAYLAAHPEIKLVFQPGTYQIKFGAEALRDMYARTDVFFSNADEARKILGVQDEPKELLKKIAALGPKIVIITDDINGAYAYDGADSWFMPIYPKEPYERTGAGDAFAAAVTAALALGKPLTEALTWGPANAMSVTQYIGPQEGLLTKEKLEEYLKSAPADYKPKKL